MKYQDLSFKLVPSLLCSLVPVFLLVPQVQALTLVRNFIEPDKMFPDKSGSAGSVPNNATGRGNLKSIFNAAADWWELAIRDKYEITISFGWASLPRNAAEARINEFSGRLGGRDPLRPKKVTIKFDNDRSTQWFLDPTPHQNEEYKEFKSDIFRVRGGTTVNGGRRFINPIDADAVRRVDLLTVAKHEIGHALGLDVGSRRFQQENVDREIDIRRPLPFADQLKIPTVEGAHLNVPTTLMAPGGAVPKGERRIQSAIDILAIAEISKFRDVNLNPNHKISTEIPEPYSILGIGIVLSLGILSTRKQN